MPKYSKTSRGKLEACHDDLQTLFNEVIKYFDNSIICGHRTEEKQNAAFDKGYSKLKYPKSKHNKIPSMAIDAIPFPLSWDDHDRMRYFAGYVMGIAKVLKEAGAIEHDVRWGGDWDMDTDLADNTFHDLVHFELR